MLQSKLNSMGMMTKSYASVFSALALITTACLTLSTSSAFAQVAWTKKAQIKNNEGVGGGRVLHVWNSKLYCGAKSQFTHIGVGMLSSSDAGATFQRSSTGLGDVNTPVYAIASNATTLFCGVRTKGIFKSTNGSNWTAINNGLGDKEPYSLAVEGETIVAGTHGGVFISKNGGAQWTAMNQGLKETSVFAVGMKGKVMVAGTTREGLYYAQDGDAAWKKAGGADILGAYHFIFVGDKIYAGTRGDGVAVSSDNGATWTLVNNGLKGKWVAGLGEHKGTLIAGTAHHGVFTSKDGGANWVAGTGLINGYFTSIASDGTNAYAISEDGNVFSATP